MERSPAASLSRPFGTLRARGAARGRPSAARLPRPGRGTLRFALAGLAALAVAGGGFLLLRGSPLVSVERVRIAGVSGPDAPAIRAALDRAARSMTTLDYSTSALRSAVAAYPVVSSVSASAHPPHALDIDVVEQLPVASVQVDGTTTAVAADGVILGPALLSGTLPSIGGDLHPSSDGRLAGASLLEQLSILGAAPAPLARLVARVYEGPYGVTAAMRDGLIIYFGDGSRPHAKWISLARVLLDQSSAGAYSIDVRVPERPAAQFGAPAASQAASTGSAPLAAVSKAAAQEQTIAALAAALSEGGAAPSSTPATSTPPATQEPSQATESQQATAPAGEPQTGQPTSPGG